MFLLGKETASKLSIIQDPFTKTSIESVSAHLHKDIFTKEWEAWGYVEFKNGLTEGKQKFTHATFEGLILQMQAFIQTLS